MSSSTSQHSSLPKSSSDAAGEQTASNRIWPITWIAIGAGVTTVLTLIAALLGFFDDRTSPSVPRPSSFATSAAVEKRAPDSNFEWDDESSVAGIVLTDAPAVAPVVTQFAQRAVARPTQSTQTTTADLLRNGETAVFDTTGHKKANGVKIRISYPRTWKAGEGDGPATVQRFISDGGRGNQAVLIQTFTRPKPYDRELTESEKQAFLTRERVQEAYGNESRILSHTITKLNGKTCGIFEMEQVLDGGGFNVAVKTLNFAVPLERAGLLISCYVQGDASAGFDAIRREYEAAKPLFTDIAKSCVFSDELNASTQGSNQLYVRVKLAHGISLSIPTSWHVFDKDWNALIRQNALAKRGDISGISEDELGRTTILRITTRPKELYGSMAINVYHTPLAPPETIEQISKSPAVLEELRQAFYDEMTSQKQISLVGDIDISTLQVDGYPAIRFNYQRKGIQDGTTVEVHLLRVYLDDKTYSITWSYGTAEEQLLAPILDACINSISIARK